MNQPAIISQEWIKVLGKGMVTLPKKWRDEMGLQEGDVIKAKKEGDKIVLESSQAQNAPYRVFSSTEIDEFLKEDELPEPIFNTAREDLTQSS